MSKSLGNSILPMEFITGNHPLLDKGYSPSVVKFLFLQSHYSSELDINIKGLHDAEKGLNKLMDAIIIIEDLKRKIENFGETELDIKIKTLTQSCKESMDDDFNTAKAIGSLFELATIVNSLKGGQIKPSEISITGLEVLKNTMHHYLFDVFGLKNENVAVANNKLEDTLQVLISLRKEAKAKKDFVTSDAIRNQLQAIGIQIKDEKDGEMSWGLM